MHVRPTLPTLQRPENWPAAPTRRALLRAFLLAVVGVGAAGAGAAAVVRRVVVAGRSMAPTLVPGDRLLVVRLPRWWPLPPGSLVAVRDPRLPDRLWVKRVSPGGQGAVVVLGDNPAESTDSRELGPLPRRSVVGKAWYRYAPPDRAGRLRRT